MNNHFACIRWTWAFSFCAAWRWNGMRRYRPKQRITRYSLTPRLLSTWCVYHRGKCVRVRKRTRTRVRWLDSNQCIHLDRITVQASPGTVAIARGAKGSAATLFAMVPSLRKPASEVWCSARSLYEGVASVASSWRSLVRLLHRLPCRPLGAAGARRCCAANISSVTSVDLFVSCVSRSSSRSPSHFLIPRLFFRVIRPVQRGAAVTNRIDRVENPLSLETNF